ncbi:unnamed protein product [Amoebophrya sp. A25]|nr:unnamed protein product [Amoebophrya sp. A25]|eukprot:GSA25T00021277001.1
MSDHPNATSTSGTSSSSRNFFRRLVPSTRPFFLRRSRAAGGSLCHQGSASTSISSRANMGNAESSPDAIVAVAGAETSDDIMRQQRPTSSSTAESTSSRPMGNRNPAILTTTRQNLPIVRAEGGAAPTATSTSSRPNQTGSLSSTTGRRTHTDTPASSSSGVTNSSRLNAAAASSGTSALATAASSSTSSRRITRASAELNAPATSTTNAVSSARSAYSANSGASSSSRARGTSNGNVVYNSAASSNATTNRRSAPTGGATHSSSSSSNVAASSRNQNETSTSTARPSQSNVDAPSASQHSSLRYRASAGRTEAMPGAVSESPTSPREGADGAEQVQFYDADLPDLRTAEQIARARLETLPDTPRFYDGTRPPPAANVFDLLDGAARAVRDGLATILSGDDSPQRDNQNTLGPVPYCPSVYNANNYRTTSSGSTAGCASGFGLSALGSLAGGSSSSGGHANSSSSTTSYVFNKSGASAASSARNKLLEIYADLDAEEPPPVLDEPELNQAELDTLSWKERSAIAESRSAALAKRCAWLEARRLRTEEFLRQQQQTYRRMSALDQHEYQTQIETLKAIKEELFAHTKAVEAEKQELQDSISSDRTCCTCLDKPSSVVFYPCCHLVCSLDLRSQRLDHCPVCRRVIHQKLPVYIA